MSSKPKTERVIAENRRARHDYAIEDRLEVGLSLVGSEVKTLRGGNGNIAEAYVQFRDGEAWLVDAHFPPYAQAHQFNHEPRRRRKLLLKRNELEKWSRKVAEKGLTAVPLKLYFSGPWVKLEIGLGRGRKHHDKRNALKDKQSRRELRDLRT